MRGVLHQYAFYASVPLGGLLVFQAPTGRAAAAIAIYATAVSALFGVSALYHRVPWRPAPSVWMRRLDHSMIFVTMAASYTSLTLLALDGVVAHVILAVFWVGVVAGVILKLVWIDAPRGLTALVYAVLGLLAAPMLPQFVQHIGPLATGLIVASGSFAAAGGATYALRRPDPLPEVFGYHEVFHLVVIASAAALYLAVALCGLHVHGHFRDTDDQGGRAESSWLSHRS
jgi:hemolysin III